MPSFLITCDGGGSHATKVATVAIFTRPRPGLWLAVPPETPGRSADPKVDAVRHAGNPTHEILANTNAPMSIEALVSDPGQAQRRRYRLDCALCSKRKTPNTLVVTGSRLGPILEKLHSVGYSRMHLDSIRAIVSSS